MHIRIGNTETKKLVDSGSACTIINKNLAYAVVSNSQKSYWVKSPDNLDLKTFSNKLIKTICVLNTSVKRNDWAADKVNVTVVEDDHRPIVGQDLFPQLGLSLTPTKHQRQPKSMFTQETNSS